MAHQNDSFIDEVTEDLRRDRLFAAFRRYGWIGLLVILAIVAGAAWREYARTASEREAQAFGDAVIAAERADDPAAALAAVPTGDHAGREALTGLLAAAAQVEAGDAEGAAATLAAVAEDASAPALARDLARLKLVTLRGAAMDPAARDAMLSDLSAPGRPFRLLALEQKAVALVAAGREEDAVTLIRQIQQEQGLTETQRRRLAEMLITLGVEDSATAAGPGVSDPVPVPAAPPAD